MWNIQPVKISDLLDKLNAIALGDLLYSMMMRGGLSGYAGDIEDATAM